MSLNIGDVAMTEFKYGKRIIGHRPVDVFTTSEWSVTSADGGTRTSKKATTRVLETEPIYLDCDGTCDLNAGPCGCEPEVVAK